MTAYRPRPRPRRAAPPGLEPEPLTVRDLAARWKVSTGHVYRLIGERKIRCFRIGAAVRIAVGEVERLEGGPGRGIADEEAQALARTD